MGSKYIDTTGNHIVLIGSEIGDAGDIMLDGAHGVGSFIKDIVKGKSLLESLEGREKMEEINKNNK